MLTDLRYDTIAHVANSMRDDVALSPRNTEADIIMAWLKCRTYSDDSAIFYAQRAIQGLKRWKDTTTYEYNKSMSDMELLLGYSNIVNNPDTAFRHLNESLHYAYKISLPNQIVQVELYLAELYKNRNDYVEGLQHLRNIESACDTIKSLEANPSQKMIIYTEIANLALEMGDLRQVNNALVTASLQYDKVDVDTRAYFLYQRIRTHIYQGQYTLALQATNKLELLYRKLGDMQMLCNSYVLHGMALCRTDDYDKAELYCSKVDTMIAESRLMPIRERLMLCGEIAAKKKDFTKAKAYLFDSITNDHRIFEKCALIESKKTYYSEQGDFKNVYKLQVEQKRYIDSIQTNVIFNNENLRAHDQLDYTDQLHAEIKYLRQQEQLGSKRRRTAWIFHIFVDIIVSTTILVFTPKS